jgi:hypothetical protein
VEDRPYSLVVYISTLKFERTNSAR